MLANNKPTLPLKTERFCSSCGNPESENPFAKQSLLCIPCFKIRTGEYKARARAKKVKLKEKAND